MAAFVQKDPAVDKDNTVDDHLCGSPQYYDSLADAYFVVEGKYLPVHTAILAAISPVFSKMFASIRHEVSQCNKQTESIHLPLPDEDLLEIGKVLKFLYKRHIMPNANSPFRQLCSSYDEICLILRFAHKWDMQVILNECDQSLAAAATAEVKETEDSFARSLKDAEVALKWATLAEQYCLKDFLAHLELALVENDDLTTWLNFPVQELSRGCLSRLLRAFQFALMKSQDDLMCLHADVYDERPDRRRIACGQEVTVPILQKWRQEQES